MAALALLVGFGSASAHAADIHERGTIDAIDGSIVKITTRDKKEVSLDLDDGWKLFGVSKALLADVKPGSFIGTASLPAQDGGEKALEVVVFPETMRGVGEGHRPWDLEPKSSMTNATVSSAVKAVDGQTVTLAYKGGEKTVTITDATPIVTVGPAEKSDVVVGAKVFVSTPSEDGGKLSKGALIVGKDGVSPPM